MTRSNQGFGRRNPHCSNCGDLRGGPFGHEISECEYRSGMTAGEVAAILPEHQRNEFWDQQIDRYFEAAGDVDLTAELDDDRTGQGALMVTHAILREDS